MKTPFVWIRPKKTGTKHDTRERRPRPKVTNPATRKPVAKTPAPADPKPSYKVLDIDIAKIKVVGKRRAVDPETVKRLVESIRTLGLRIPITISPLESGPQLVAGLHRLEAAKILKWKTIPCEEIRGGKVIAEMWQISENLDRSSLTTQQEDEGIARWVELWNSLHPSSGKNEEGGKGRPKSGISEAARHLSVKGKTHSAKRKNIERALKRNSIHPDAKKAASEAGIVDRTQLNEIGDQKTKEAQLAKVEELKAKPHKPDRSADSGDPETPFDQIKRRWLKEKKMSRPDWEHASFDDQTRVITEVLKYPLKN
jgi:ParB-like chromosome segregation protein Spo0J